MTGECGMPSWPKSPKASEFPTVVLGVFPKSGASNIDQTSRALTVRIPQNRTPQVYGNSPIIIVLMMCKAICMSAVTCTWKKHAKARASARLACHNAISNLGISYPIAVASRSLECALDAEGGAAMRCLESQVA